ncbi:helix-turn-helix transcriptional regulator [Jatrophihabitans sp. YIM 134969]
MAEPNRELADFLRRARGRVDPTATALPADGRVRRVPGLRREEVAFLAGVSSDYYARLEQGRPIVPSASVVDALVRALALDAAGRSHLQSLLDHNRHAGAQRPAAQRARATLSQFVDALDAPALVLGRRTDVLAQNRGSRALIADFDAMPARERNYVRWMLLSAEASRLFVDWDEQARAAVESLRLDVGRHPDDPAARALVADLSARSETFGRWWEAHGVHQRTHGTKRLHHPTVGRLDVQYETLTLPGDDDQTLFVYTTAPGSPSREALALLASWSLTPRPA